MEIRCLDGCSSGGVKVLEEEKSKGKGEKEIGGERKEDSEMRRKRMKKRNKTTTE